MIAVTASVMQQDRKQITEAGFDAYVGKPINLKEFLDTVRRVLESGEDDELAGESPGRRRHAEQREAARRRCSPSKASRVATAASGEEALAEDRRRPA